MYMLTDRRPGGVLRLTDAFPSDGNVWYAKPNESLDRGRVVGFMCKDLLKYCSVSYPMTERGTSVQVKIQGLLSLIRLLAFSSLV